MGPFPSPLFAHAHAALPLRAFDIQVYRACEVLTEVLLYAMVLFGPWAFGTTQSWSIWTMNIAGYALGLLLAHKLGIRWLKGYRPPLWHHCFGTGRAYTKNRVGRHTLALAVLTILLLGYCFLSAINAGATFRNDTLSFEYYRCIQWLPHSYDASGSWAAFWRYLGLACVFWALCDWLSGVSPADAREQKTFSGTAAVMRPLSARLCRLLWVLALNGGLLAAEGIVQKLNGGGKLLFLVQPRIHQIAEGQFGPYAYRANAAQYLNLVWPACLGFWWHLRTRSKRRGVLLVCAWIMAASPAIAGSRAGAIISLCMGVLAVGLILGLPGSASGRRSRGAVLLGSGGAAFFWLIALALGVGLGASIVGPRFAQLGDALERREALYTAARPMLSDFPLFGTGPGTFETVSSLYIAADAYWPSQLHNDWLELRITFGLFGSALLLGALVIIAWRCLAAARVSAGRGLPLFIGLALAGCLVHARYDFPFQVYSVAFLFVLLAAVVFALPGVLPVQGGQSSKSVNQ